MSTPQERKAKAQAAARTSDRRGNVFLIGGVVVVLVIALVVGGVIWSSSSGGSMSAGEQKLPQGVSKGEPIEPYAEANPPEDAPVVDVYEDFRCPICKSFEQVAGQTITQLAEDGKIRLRVHLKTVIDSNTGGHSSAVAASSAICAMDQGKWTEYHKALFALQPERETEEGFPEGAYTEAAKQAGMSGKALREWQQCTDEKTYVDYVQGVDAATAEEGITGTPVIAVDGTRLNWAGLTDGRSLSSFDTAKFKDILTSGEVPDNLVAAEQ